jgi:hypothetical protein
MAHKIFFDTNILSSPESTEHFFGGRDQLSRFQRIAEILIPTIVNSEIRNQKKKNLISKRDSFKSNPFFNKQIRQDEEFVSDDHIEKWLDEIESNEKIVYTKVSLKNRDILQNIVDMAVTSRPPFEVNNDKGFKDVIIYFTILQYTEDNPSDQVYFICKDGRLGEAFKGNHKVKVLKDYDEYERHQKDYFLSSYFIEKIKEHLNDETINVESVEDIKLDKELNWILKIHSNKNFYEVEVDYVSKEVISYF